MHTNSLLLLTIIYYYNAHQCPAFNAIVLLLRNISLDLYQNFMTYCPMFFWAMRGSNGVSDTMKEVTLCRVEVAEVGGWWLVVVLWMWRRWLGVVTYSGMKSSVNIPLQMSRMKWNLISVVNLQRISLSFRRLFLYCWAFSRAMSKVLRFRSYCLIIVHLCAATANCLSFSLSSCWFNS